MKNEEIKEHRLDKSHVTKQNYTLKILFGPMYGCELVLPAADYFLIVNPSSELLDRGMERKNFHEHAVHYAQNTLYIPCETPSANLVLHLSGPADEHDPNQFNVEVHDKNGENITSRINCNTIFSHENIKLAIKSNNDSWSDSIKTSHIQAPVNEPAVQQIVLHAKRKKLKVIAFIFLFLTFFTLFFTYLYQEASTEQQVVSLNDALAGAPESLDIIKGRDNNIYILTRSIQTYEWVQEALYKLKDYDNIMTVSLSKMNKSIVNDLIKSGYPVLQVDDQHPQTPVFAIYRPLSSGEKSALKSIVMKKLPYADDVNFILKTKDQLLTDAQQGLERLNVSYRKVKTTNGFAFIIRDALSDNSLNSLRTFIKQYQYLWGVHFISFSINLDENWLQNKSYVDSANGYLFLNPRHWYFPLDNKEF